jgi:hypothetical protein
MRRGRHGARRALGTLVGLALIAGCSLVTDLGGLTAGAAPTTDTNAADAAASDAAPSDATVADASVSSDSAAAVDAAPSCAAPAFCDDFERTDTKGKWDTVVASGGSLTIDSLVSHSATRSLRADLADAATDRTIFLERVLPANTLGVKVAFFYRFEGSAVVLSIQLENPLSAVFVRLDTSGTSLFMTNYQASQTHEYPLGSTGVDQWDQMTVELRRSTAAATPSIRVMRGANATVVVDAQVPIVLGTLSAYRVGIAYASPGSSAGSVWIDDIRVDTLP